MRPAPINGPLLVVAHDAGGAELVSSWVRRQGMTHVHLVAEGPARDTFKRKLPNNAVSPRSELPRLVRASKFVLTGTSWGGDLENLAIKEAAASKVRSAAFIDHWVNYPQRFMHDGENVLPNEIWVGDEYALPKAEREFPPGLLRFEPNPYFADIHDEFASLPSQERPSHNELRILYVAEPISEHYAMPANRHLHPGYDEYAALEHFLQQLSFVKAHSINIRFRLHPSEINTKYASVLSALCRFELHYSAGTSLLEDCAWARWVVGCESMAMVVGLIARKLVFTCIPPGGRNCQLPQAAIQPIDRTSIHRALRRTVSASIC